MSTRPKQPNFLLPAVVTALYAGVIALLCCYHEPWRDEVRALSIAKASGSFSALLGNLTNEGHPVLWYLLLKFGLCLLQNSEALKVVSAALAVGGCYLFLRYSPFPLLLRLLFPWGLLPLYLYSVQARNYGLGMFLLFLFCTLYRAEKRNWVALCLVLALLANSSAYGLIQAGALFIVLACRFLSSAQLRRSANYAALAAAGLGIAFSLWTITPDSSSVVTTLPRLDTNLALRAALDAMLSQGGAFHNGLYLPLPLLATAAVLALYLLLIPKPELALYLFSTVFGMELLHRMVYSGGALRHQGFLLLTFLAALWLEPLTPPRNKIIPLNYQLFGRRIFAVFIGLVLLAQVKIGVSQALEDIRSPWSSSKQLAELLSRRPEFAGIPLVSEPYYLIEALPYYLTNPIYLPREDRFRSYVKFTAQMRMDFSLSQLLDQVEAKLLPVSKAAIILLPPSIAPGESELLYGASFAVDTPSIERLNARAEKVGCLTEALSDENYCVWLYR